MTRKTSLFESKYTFLLSIVLTLYSFFKIVTMENSYGPYIAFFILGSIITMMLGSLIILAGIERKWNDANK